MHKSVVINHSWPMTATCFLLRFGIGSEDIGVPEQELSLHTTFAENAKRSMSICPTLDNWSNFAW